MEGLTEEHHDDPCDDVSENITAWIELTNQQNGIKE